MNLPRFESRWFRPMAICLGATLLVTSLPGCGSDAYEERFEKNLHPAPPPPAAAAPKDQNGQPQPAP